MNRHRKLRSYQTDGSGNSVLNRPIPARLEADLDRNSLKFMHSPTITRARTAARPRRDFGVSKNQWDTPRGRSFAQALRGLAKA